MKGWEDNEKNRSKTGNGGVNPPPLYRLDEMIITTLDVHLIAWVCKSYHNITFSVLLNM